MKFKHAAWLVIPLLLLGAGSLTAKRTAAQEGQVNLLLNPGFENGHHFQDGIPEITVPDGWRLHWLDGVSFWGSEQPAARPESVVWWIYHAPQHEQRLFFRDGIYCLKVFKGWLPMYSALSQDVGGLEIGRRYRLVAPVYIDLVADYDDGGNKIAPSRLDAGFVRLGASRTGAAWRDEGAISYSGWWTAENVSPFYSSYPVFVYEFTATHDNMTVWVEFGSRVGYMNNGFFMDTFGLYALDEVDNTVSPTATSVPVQVPAGPPPTSIATATPRPDGSVVHTVQPGDTLWLIAAHYDVSLDELRATNNIGQFIHEGDELVIHATSPEVATPEPTAEPAPTVIEEEDEVAAAAGTEENAPDQAAASAPEESEPAESSESTAAEPDAGATAAALCITAFDDPNRNGYRDAGEGLLAGVVIAVSNDQHEMGNYTTDGISEPYCFSGLEPGSYRVTQQANIDWVATTDTTWGVSLHDGDVLSLEFGNARPQSSAPATVANNPAGDEADNTSGEARWSQVRAGVYTATGVFGLLLIVGAGVFALLSRRKQAHT